MSKKNKHKKLASAYGSPVQGAIKASGHSPSVNPFMLPKEMGLNVFTNTFPSNYYQNWDISTWRMACEQARNQGLPIQYAAMCKFVIESSTFIQGIIREITVAVETSKIFLEDENGDINEEATEEICKQRWFIDMTKEIAMANFYGFVGLNIDFFNNKCYRYPMQNIDPINQFLRESTYNTGDGLNFSDHPNMFFVQPSATEEFFLGWMQPISKSFIYMNKQLKNWNAYGTKTAVPQATIGYPAGDVRTDENGIEYNPRKQEAEQIARTMSPEEAVVYPYTIDGGGNIVKAIEVGFESSNSGASQHQTYKDFNAELKEEILQMITLSTLSSNAGKHGSQSLGVVHERKIEMVHEAIQEQIIAYLNDDYFKNKLGVFYKNIEKFTFSRNRIKKFNIDEVEKISNVMNNNGLKLSKEFFQNVGVPIDMIEEKEIEETISMSPEKSKKLGAFFFRQNPKLEIGSEYVGLSRSKTKIQDSRFIVDQELDYWFNNQSSEAKIYDPTYEYYNSLLFSAMEEGLNPRESFVALNSTAYWEAYMINAFQFSSAKSSTQASIIRELVYDENKRLRDYTKFKDLASDQVKIINETWLRTEYDLCKSAAASADVWRRMKENKDIKPYWIYVTANDERVRESHKPLNGKRFKIGDPYGDKLYPPNGWNCRCTSKSLDDAKLVVDDENAKKLLEKYVPADFRHNVGEDGIFSLKNSSYNAQVKSANDLTNKDYSTGTKTKLAAQDSSHARFNNICQNSKFLLNVVVGKNEMKRIEDIALVVSRPDMIFGSWINRQKEKGTRIVFEKKVKGLFNYVTTENGKLISFQQKGKQQKLKGVKFLR